MKIGTNIQINKIKRRNPYLFPRKIWDSIVKEEIKGDSEIVCVEYLMFSYQTLTRTEYELLNSNAKNATYKISEDPEKWKLDAVNAFVYENGTIPNLPSWWTDWKKKYEKLGKTELFGTKMLSIDMFKNFDFGSICTNEISQLDLEIVVYRESIMRLQKCFPVPSIEHIDYIVKNHIGYENFDKETFTQAKKYILNYFNDPIVGYPNARMTKPFCLQEIINNVGCHIHDKLKEYKYKYCISNSKDVINVKIKHIDDNKISVHFTSAYTKNPIDKYLVWNHAIDPEIEKSIVEIYDNSTYRKL